MRAMTNYESLFPDAVPSEVMPALSFANSHVLRIDTTYQQGLSSKRVITYPNTSDKEIESISVADAELLDENVLEPRGLLSQTLSMEGIRKALAKKGLMLGTQVENPDKDYISFIIPGSARPAKYDAPHSTEGAFSYTDGNMFGDLGGLLGAVALTGPEHPVVIERAVGLNTAINGFTRQGERSLLLVPGFELNLKSVLDDDQVESYYRKKLTSEFGDRFDANLEYFLGGLHSAFGRTKDEETSR